MERPLTGLDSDGRFGGPSIRDGELLAGRYRIVRFLAEGGMGEVYEVEDLELDERAALKTIRPEISLDPRARERFKREVQLARRVTHPNASRIFDLGYHGDIAFLTMELLQGETLADRIERAGPMTTGEALPIIEQVVAGLEAVHKAGIVHRDLKSANVVLMADGPGGRRAVVTDFGLARPTADTAGIPVKKSGLIAGTPDYMAPEQLENGPVTAAADIYALGVMLFEMVTGSRPFPSVSLPVAAVQRSQEPAPSPRAIVADLDERWERAILRCLEREPPARFPTAMDVVRALRAEPAHRGAANSRAAARTTLVVLPFQNLGGAAEEDYFSDGLTEELITHLARLRPDRLAVIARASAMRYRGAAKDVRSIGRELGAGHALEGSVRRVGQRVRVTAQLLETANSTCLWAETFDQPLTDVIGIQTAIAERVGDSLSLQLLADGHAAHAHARDTSPEARDAYLKGRYFWNMRTPDGFRRAIRYFREASQADPRFAPAYAGLADTYALLGFWAYGALPARQAFPLAREAAERALQLDAGLAEAHATLGWVRYGFEWNWPAAEDSFRRALEINPSYSTAHQWYACCLAAQGRFDEAAAEGFRARELDPISLVINHTQAWIHYFARRFEKALEHCARTLEINPHFPVTHFLLAGIHAEMGQREPCFQEYDTFERLSGGNPMSIALRGSHHARFGETAEAEQALARLHERARGSAVPSWQFALLLSALRRTEEALTALEQAVEERSDFLAYLKVEPQWDPLRSERRFQAVLERIGLGSD